MFIHSYDEDVWRDMSIGNVWLSYVTRIMYPTADFIYANLFLLFVWLFDAIVTHNFKWVNITHICLIWDQAFTHLGV